MKRLTIRWRPELESLESMVLLSGVAGAAERPAYAAAAMVATRPVSNAVVSLSGSASGTYRAGRALGSPYSFSGKGNISPLGRASVKGSLQLAAQTGQMTVATRHGKIFANLSTPGGVGPPVNYTITGGTGQFAGASGTGTGVLSTSPSHGRGPAHGGFLILFQAAT
jgi:hypothetical protein